MAQKQHEMKYVISAQASGFTSAFKEAQTTLSSTQQKLTEVTKAQADISAYQKQQQAIDKTKAELELLEKQYDNYQREMDETGQFSANLANKQDKAAQKAKTAEQTLKEQEQTLQQLGQALNEAGIDTDNLTSESERLKSQETQLVQEGKEAAQSMDQMEQEAQEAAKKLDDMGDSADEAGDSADSFGQQTTAAIQGVSGLLASAGIAQKLQDIYDAFMECASASGDFQQAMSNVEALSGASAAQMEELTATAKELGATSQWTAEESASAMGYMAMAGWDAEQMLSGIDAVMALASASGEDLATVSDIVTDSLTAFGLTAADTAHFTDVLAATATSANTSVGIMGETFQYAAPVAGALGYTIEDVSVAIGLMANAGIKGSNAGTALRNVFNGLLSGVELTSSAFGDVTVSAVQADGTMMDFGATIDTLRGYFDQMTEAEKVNNAISIAGQRGYAGLLSILNATDDDFAKLTESINDCTGAAQEMADIKLDNLNGELTLMESAWDGVKIAVGDALSPVLGEAYGDLSNIMGVVTEFVNENPSVVAGVAAFTGVTLTATAAVTGLAGAMALMNAAGISALPVLGGIVAAAAAVGIAAGAIYDIATSAESTTEALTRISGEMATISTNEDLIAQYQQLTADLQDSSLGAEELAEKQTELEDTIQALKDAYPDLLGNIEAGTKAWDLQTAAIQATLDAEQAAGKVELGATVAEGIDELRQLQAAYEDAEQAQENAVAQMEQALNFDADSAIAEVQTLRDYLADGLEVGTIEFGDETFNAKIAKIKTNLETLTGTTVEIDGLADVDYYLGEVSADSYDAANGVAYWKAENADAAQQVSDSYQALSEQQQVYLDLLDSGTFTMSELREMCGDASLSISDFGITMDDVGQMVASGTMTIGEAATKYGLYAQDVRLAAVGYATAQKEANEAAEDGADALDDAGDSSQKSYRKQLQLQYAAKLVADGLMEADQAAKAYGLDSDELTTYIEEESDKQDALAAALALVENGYMSAETAAAAYGVTADEISNYGIEQKALSISDATEALATAYNDAYDAAYTSFSGQFDLWDKVDKVTATNVSTLKTALQSQIDYWDSYGNNLATVQSKIQALQNQGYDTSGIEAYLNTINDGSTDAAGAIAGLASASASDLQTINEKYSALQGEIQTAANATALASNEVQTALDNANQIIADGVAEFDMSEEALTAASNTIKGYVDGLDEANNVGAWMTTNGAAWLSALNAALGVHSPSTITEQSGVDTMQGFINGVDGMTDSVSDTMISSADAAIAAFQVQMAQSKFYSFGVNAMQGAINGIKAMQSSLVAAAAAAGTAAANAYKEAQDIHSPSKLFYWFSEMDIQGAIQGLEKNQDEANQAFAAAAESGIAAYQNASREMVELSPYGDAVLDYGTFQANALANQAMQEISSEARSMARPAEVVEATPYDSDKIVITLAPVFNIQGVGDSDDIRDTLNEFTADELREIALEAVREAAVDSVRKGYI
jgi:TP901 family phage tail tape measure protein